MADIKHNSLITLSITFKSYPEGQKPSEIQDAEDKVWKGMQTFATNVYGNKQVTGFKIRISQQIT